MRLRRGFTLIEMIVVVAVMALMASFTFPKFTQLRETTYRDAVANDLKNLVQAQEILFTSESRYADSTSDASLAFKSSAKVNVTIEYRLADNSWLATGGYISYPSAQCAVAMGPFVPEGYVGSRIECGVEPPAE